MPVLADHVDLISRDWLLSHGLRIAVILVVSVVVMLAARLAVRRMQRRLEGVESITQELDLQRAATLTQAVSYVVRVVVWTVAFLLVLGEVGISLGPLLAGAGIAGVAIGFGAQSLVRDFLSGFFILLENQFGVGDGVEVLVGSQMMAGKVESLSLRTSELRAFDGTLHIIPNGNILLVSNKSKGWARAIVDVTLAYDADLDRVTAALEDLFEELKGDDLLREAFHTGPEMLGVERLGDHDMVVRVVAETRPSRRGDLERELRARIRKRFGERGIALPTSG